MWYKNVLIFCLFSFCTGCALFAPPFDQSENEDALQLIDRGTLLLREGRLEEAEASFELAYELKPGAAVLDGLGCVAMLQGDAESAEEYFLSAFQMDSKYYNALGNLAMLYEANGLHSDAERLYEKLITVDQKNFRLRNNFAAFLIDYNNERVNQERSKKELLKAASLVSHQILEDNINKLAIRD